MGQQALLLCGFKAYLNDFNTKQEPEMRWSSYERGQCPGPVTVAKVLVDLWLDVKDEPNLDIAGFRRNVFKYYH